MAVDEVKVELRETGEVRDPHVLLAVLATLTPQRLPLGLRFRALFLLGALDASFEPESPFSCGPEAFQRRQPPIRVQHTCECHCDYGQASPLRDNATVDEQSAILNANVTETPPEQELPEVRRECWLDIVGKPHELGHNLTGATVGSWLLDTVLPDPRRWLISGYMGTRLYEYAHQDDLLRRRESRVISLNATVAGTGSVVANESLYYHAMGTNRIVRLHLHSLQEDSVEIPDMAFRDCDRTIHRFDCKDTMDPYLYNLPHNYADISRDENGLWVVFRQIGDTELSVARLGQSQLGLWLGPTLRLPLSNATGFGNTFILCGVLYALRSATRKSALIDYQADLSAAAERSRVRIYWRNPYSSTTQVDYDPLQKRMYFLLPQSIPCPKPQSFPFQILL